MQNTNHKLRSATEFLARPRMLALSAALFLAGCG